MGHFYLNDKIQHIIVIPNLKPNGPILTEYQILHYVIFSTAEAEVGPMHLNGKLSIPIHTTSQKMGHPQGPTFPQDLK